jgi:hypothetical protein
MSFRNSLRKAVASTIVAIGSKTSRVFLDPRYFQFWERNGLHILPISYHDPIPDTTSLREELWSKRSELIGLNMHEESQIALLSQFQSAFRKEYESLPRDRTAVDYQYYINNTWFGSVDGEILYCIIRHFKPRKIYEIGSGNSTYLSAQALLSNQLDGHPAAQLIAFEPHPNDVLKAGFPGLSALNKTRIEDVPISEFGKLERNDILFIDSSHILKLGGDVQYEFLEILPRLKEGVFIHVHDIFLPAEYPKRWVLNDLAFYNEQYLLQAFLAFNHSFEVIWAGSFMHLKHPDELEAAFSSYKRTRTWPGSFWMRKIE